MKLTEMPVEGYEKVVRCDDPAYGLTAFIAVHDTTLGPALGGIRMWPYSSWQEALTDVKRLAQGMTYKSAVADTGLGGGKAVIIGDPKHHKSAPLLRAMGRFIETFNGTYLAAEDVGMSESDMEVIREETPYVTGLPYHYGSSGNPAPFTAFGVFVGMRACLERQFHTDRFDGVRVAVQGCGNVAEFLCGHLHEAGAQLIVADVDAAKAERLAERYDAQVVAPAVIHQSECDIYAPCALGGILNDDTIPQLRCRIVAGSANNQCLGPEHGVMLKALDILYAPDFVINAGGVINISVELEPGGYNASRAWAKVGHIATVLPDIFDYADQELTTTEHAAHELAADKLASQQRTRADLTVTRAHQIGGSVDADTIHSLAD
ncbi:leucine dehydrogenase [Candidatus Entotheonella serta]|nr:leucine dehydrogenase [Candidatus Entotheonella serta]